MVKKLAIIIPAYKIAFLRKALDSLSKQTCKDFHVYVGDDNSPYDIKSIVLEYNYCLSIKYHRFENNLGSKDLVAQWERCISLSRDEPWVWLFSDDDEIEERCVEKFYAEINKGAKHDLYHFDVDIINEEGEKIHESRFPKIVSSIDLLINKLRGKLSSYVVEYIFSRQHFETCEGFQKFDMAWCSDDATWIKLGYAKGIKTIKDAHVRWRKSNLNISPNNHNRDIVKRKIQSDNDFIKWVNNYLDTSLKVKLSIKMAEITWYSTNLKKYSLVLTKDEINENLRYFCKNLGAKYLFYIAKIYMIFK